ncbi:MAG: glycosyltransferase family 4 protein [Nitrospirales bacterium]
MRKELGISGLLVMYVGNLEEYQGIDLLLESFALVLKNTDLIDLVIIGGQASDIQKYERKSRHLQIEQRIHFLGPKPVGHLAEYLSQADILVSPRIKGDNTPMKIYSYLHSGKALLATRLATHTQVLDSRVAALADPFPDAFSKAMLRLIEDETLRMDLGKAGKQLIEEKHTYTAFRKKMLSLFDWLEMEVAQKP